MSIHSKLGVRNKTTTLHLHRPWSRIKHFYLSNIIAPHPETGNKMFKAVHDKLFSTDASSFKCCKESQNHPHCYNCGFSQMFNLELDQLVTFWNPYELDGTVSICGVCGCVNVCVCVHSSCTVYAMVPKAAMKMNCNCSVCAFDAGGCLWQSGRVVAMRRVCLPCAVVFLLHDPSIIQLLCICCGETQESSC